MEEILNFKKKIFKKIKRPKRKSFREFKRYDIDIQNEEDIKEKQEKIKKEMKEKLIEKKMYTFFGRIQNLKNHKVKNYNDELKIFIDEHLDKIDDLERKDKEYRINNFCQKFELNRKKEEMYKKIRKRDMRFVSPVVFSSTSDNFRKIVI